jgi:hypothetical protein
MLGEVTESIVYRQNSGRRPCVRVCGRDRLSVVVLKCGSITEELGFAVSGVMDLIERIARVSVSSPIARRQRGSVRILLLSRVPAGAGASTSAQSRVHAIMC